MTIATILVHLDTQTRCGARVDLAVDLARRHGARLTGLFAEIAAPQRVGTVASWPSADYVARVDAARSRFVERTRGLGERARFVDLDRGGEHTVVLRAVEYASSFDLVVLGGYEAGGQVPADLAEHLLLESGRPVLIVPPVGTFVRVGARPMFAWHRSRSAARALCDALPLIEKEAEALVVEAVRAGEAGDEMAALTLDQLAAHGVAAEWRRVPMDHVDLMDTLLNQASDHGADLLVSGAFDRSGFTLFGGGAGTRYLLRHMTLPVLLAN
ncbi:universal stress protein [Siculibacillus lacustris]|uniref:Universal stress protein n=1 Tax=Siculibacillus lacustris TaxID=1549641 RepID=A0A4Q9VSH5_9HYPH|nr:universal stress protein [Siculibacillus lacustris]TBW38947.1 universal stress protein [Siculibacillus lacustris]